MNVGSSKDEQVAGKRALASRYITEPWRFKVSTISVTMSSDHGSRDISLVDGTWSCSCEFFSTHQICSHTIALHDMLAEMIGVTVPNLAAGNSQ